MKTPENYRFKRTEVAPHCAGLDGCHIEFLGRAEVNGAGQITEGKLAVQIRQNTTLLVTATIRQISVDKPLVSRLVCSPVLAPGQARTLARALDAVDSIVGAWESLIQCASFEALFHALHAEAARIPSAGAEVKTSVAGQHEPLCCHV